MATRSVPGAPDTRFNGRHLSLPLERSMRGQLKWQPWVSLGFSSLFIAMETGSIGRNRWWGLIP